MLLQDYDPEKIAVINPDDLQKKLPDFPDTLVSLFSLELFERVADILKGKIIYHYHDADGLWPVYEIEYKGKKIAFVKARVGSAACVGCFEEVFALGVKRLILTGNCGVLDSSIEDCGIIIPNRALRDEGTSFHYLPPSDDIEVNKVYKDEFKQICRNYGYPYVEGATWTTDGLFRETRKKVNKRKEMGAICVEMECSAVQALCDFRGIEFFQYLYAGDNLDQPEWDPRSISGNARLNDKEKIALLAFELAAAI